MPKLLSEQRLNQVTYVSMADYMRQMDEIEDIEDKLAFTTRYLLAYGAEERDVSLAEAIHIAQVKMADASAKLRVDEIMVPDEAVHPRLKPEEDAPNRQFMIEPVAFLQEQAGHLATQAANGEPTEESQRRIESYQLMSAVLANGVNSGLENEVSELEIEPTARNVEARLRAKFGGAQQLEAALDATKPGFFSKMFGTSSRAYHNLDQAYEAFNNPDHALYGNMNSLDKAATEYLQHLFPRWNPRNGMISKSAIDHLDGTKKARAMLSYSILRATAEERASEQTFEKIISGNRQLRADQEAQASDEVLENEEFQQHLLEDEAAELDQAEKDYHDNFKIEPGEELDNDDPAI